MGRKRTNFEEIEPKNAKWLNMKIIINKGDINRLVKELPTLKPKGIKVDTLNTQGNVIELTLRTNKPNLFMFMLKSARYSIANGIMFKSVFKDFEHSLDWCGYYETTPTSTIEGSRFNNREKINKLLKEHFS